MTTERKNEKRLISTLKEWEASGNLEPGKARAAKAACMDFCRARTANQREKALGKLWAAIRMDRRGDS